MKTYKEIISEVFGATFPNEKTMKIVLPVGALIEENCHTVSIKCNEDGSVTVKSRTLKGIKSPKRFSQDELINFFNNYKGCVIMEMKWKSENK